MRRALLFNFLSAIFAILGSIISLLIGSRIENFSALIVPVAAGGFIYIAGSDLVPELNKEVDPVKSLIQLISIGAGLVVMLLLLMLK